MRALVPPVGPLQSPGGAVKGASAVRRIQQKSRLKAAKIDKSGRTG